MPKRTSDFRDGLLADLRDSQEAAHYLNAALEESEQMVLVALRDIAEARQMARIAGDAGVAREALYRMLSKTGNPTFSSLTGVLNALGLRMTFEPISTAQDNGGGLQDGCRRSLATVRLLHAQYAQSGRARLRYANDRSLPAPGTQLCAA